MTERSGHAGITGVSLWDRIHTVQQYVLRSKEPEQTVSERIFPAESEINRAAAYARC